MDTDPQYVPESDKSRGKECITRREVLLGTTGLVAGTVLGGLAKPLFEIKEAEHKSDVSVYPLEIVDMTLWKLTRSSTPFESEEDVSGQGIAFDGRKVGLIALRGANINTGENTYSFGMRYSEYVERVSPETGEIGKLRVLRNTEGLKPSQVCSAIGFHKFREEDDNRMVSLYPYAFETNIGTAQRIELKTGVLYAVMPVTTAIKGQGIYTDDVKEHERDRVVSESFKMGASEGYLTYALFEVKRSSDGEVDCILEMMGFVDNLGEGCIHFLTKKDDEYVKRLREYLKMPYNPTPTVTETPKPTQTSRPTKTPVPTQTPEPISPQYDGDFLNG